MQAPQNVPRRPLAWLFWGALMLAPLALPWQCRIDDIAVYWRWVVALAEHLVPYRDFAVEYPPLALVAVVLPSLAAASLTAYAWHFVVFLWALDVGHRHYAMPPWARSLTHLTAFTALEAILYVTCYRRLDLFAVMALSLALAALVRRPQGLIAWVLLAVATGIKLYPVVVWPPMAVYAWRQGVGAKRLGLGVGLFMGFAWVLLVAPCAWSEGAGLNWLRYHQERGLQAASNYVAWHLVQGHLGQSITTVFAFGAVHIAEPWAKTALAWAQWATPATWLVTLLTTLPRLRTGLGLYRIALALVLGVLLTAKVLSPQYALWLVPLTVAAVGPKKGGDLTLFVLIFGICVATAMLYPGETLMLNGQIKRQLALIVRAMLMAIAWLWLLITPERPGEGARA